MIVVEGSGSSLLGRDLLAGLKLNWKALSVHHTSKQLTLNAMLEKHKIVFRTELGKAKNIEANSKLNVKDEATPKFFKARSVLYALRERVERELDQLQ